MNTSIKIQWLTFYTFSYSFKLTTRCCVKRNLRHRSHINRKKGYTYWEEVWLGLCACCSSSLSPANKASREQCLSWKKKEHSDFRLILYSWYSIFYYFHWEASKSEAEQLPGELVNMSKPAVGSWRIFLFHGDQACLYELWQLIYFIILLSNLPLFHYQSYL